jgi:hypothetical protein
MHRARLVALIRRVTLIALLLVFGAVPALMALQTPTRGVTDPSGLTPVAPPNSGCGC